MPLHELQEPELLQISEARVGRAAVLFSTPMCGTCKVAERMLEVAEAAGVDYPLAKININFAPRLREQWQIASVPCLVILRNGVLLRKEYAMRSVDYLFGLLKDAGATKR
ncbi:thioredoxin family protein [Paenibacillus sp. PL2-23]|uniref:thioredoxin family protein n=1 Tax=Paenibacillus sp. PL2-23 TaxID=2100729 RepID=UPI0030F652FC